MLEETKKSINTILNERVSSPFYGTLIISWLLWNWKIIYLTIFISEKTLKKNKIDYIVSNYNDCYHLILYPLLSTIIILTILPFITNGAYWIDLNFEKWRVEKKNEIQKKQLLTIEQSISLREQIVNMENRFETLLSDKNAEINQLKLLISELEKNKSTLEITPPKTENSNTQNEVEYLAKKINNNEKLKAALKTINYYVLGNYSGLSKSDNLTTEILTFFESNELIEDVGKGLFKWTQKGKDINKIISDEQF